MRTTTVRCARGVRRRAALALGRWRSAADSGMTTAEYAVGTVAACGFGAVLYKVVTSDAVASALQRMVEKALDAGF